MITPAEAEALVQQSISTLPAEDCPLAAALGRVLRAPILADRDQPPFDRVTMDGFAIRSSTDDGAAKPRRLRSIGFQAAGMRPLTLTEVDTCVEIATGAVLPIGADAVVPYENVERNTGPTTAPPDQKNTRATPGNGGDEITISNPTAFPSGTFVHRRGSDAAAGKSLVLANTCLTSREIAVAASCGATTLRVTLQPRIAVIASGDELADVDAVHLAPHHLRRSNDYALRAALIANGFTRVDRLHLRDVREEILLSLKQWINEYDALILTGGVSKGKFDFLPGVLTELGVNKKFQGVAQRPGKPFWFGISSRTTPVFALPGNPVSTFTCFTRYVLPGLRQMIGLPPERAIFAALTEAVAFKHPLALLLPVRLESGPDARTLARPAHTNTSGDFAGLVGTEGFLELPSGPGTFPTGQVARFYRWA